MTLSAVAGDIRLILQLIEMALKCQEQCRKTLKTLNDIQNPQPKTVFIKNAIAQQVNQLAVQTEELQKRLEAQPYAAMDFGSQRTPETLDTAVETLEPINRAEDGRRKGEGKPKQL
jgi:hypothetical protein